MPYYLRFGDHDNVDRHARTGGLRKCDAQQAFHPVAPHRAADTPPDGQTQARGGSCVSPHVENKQLSVQAAAASQHTAELRAVSDSPLACGRHSLRLDGESLAPLLSTALQDEYATLGTRPDEEAMSSLALAVVGLKGSFHEEWPGRRTARLLK